MTATDPLAAARRHVEAAPGPEPERARILAFLDQHPDALERACLPGHLTGSAAVLDAEGRRALLLLHAKLGVWLQPGGHADGMPDLAVVALAEATEETGIRGLHLSPVPIDLDVHHVAPPGEGPHLHLDVRYLAIAPPGAEPVGNHESHDLRWITRPEIDGFPTDPSTKRLLRAAFRGFRSSACR
ncbi:MAG: NUDIX hydrolase [Acidimicrobiales bacterium]